MSINLVQWEGSTVTPKLDAIMYDDGSYGIIKGCAITHQGTNLLKIANGFIKIAGRLIEIAEETIQCQVSESGTVNGQLWIRLDLSSVTPAVFMTEAAAVLTPLTQNADCNFQNGIYELQLATYNIDESVITNLVETAPELEKLRTALENIDLAANKVTYDNTHSGLSANKVQGAIDEINDNLTSKLLYTEITSLTTIGDVIDYIVANENIPLGTTRKYSIYNTTLNGYDIEITHANLTVERYTGTALSNHGNDNYTFYKDGGASTVTNPFKKPLQTVTKSFNASDISFTGFACSFSNELKEIVGITSLEVTNDGGNHSFLMAGLSSIDFTNRIVNARSTDKSGSGRIKYTITAIGYTS